MPKGVEVYVENGFAEIDFVDRRLRGPGLRALLEVTPPELVETLTRSGPRRRYRVPTGNAAEAGLLDSPVKSLPSGDTGSADALADASPAGARPTPQTVKDRAYGSGQGTYTGPLRPGSSEGSQSVTSTEDVLGGTSVQTTLVPGSGTGTKSVAPSHAEVIERVKAAATPPPPQPAPEPVVVRGPWPDGEPSTDWKRAELDAYANQVKHLDTTRAASKADVVELINTHA
jgi:hypothetical protein